MATLYEYYNTGDNSFTNVRSADWAAQTLTPATAHKITSVKLKGYRIGFPGTITVSIRATDGSGHPTGGDLCSGTTNGNTLTPSSPGEWREITLGAGYDLEASTKYAIVVRATAGDVDNYFIWRLHIGGTYAGGNVEISANSGVGWSAEGALDAMFEEWGEPVVTAPTVTTQAATNVQATTARLNGQISNDGGEACQYRFRYKKSGGSYIYTTWTGAKT
ncbi:unnamed protein product, partial [marine sediment metagenome]